MAHGQNKMEKEINKSNNNNENHTRKAIKMIY